MTDFRKYCGLSTSSAVDKLTGEYSDDTSHQKNRDECYLNLSLLSFSHVNSNIENINLQKILHTIRINKKIYNYFSLLECIKLATIEWKDVLFPLWKQQKYLSETADVLVDLGLVLDVAKIICSHLSCNTFALLELSKLCIGCCCCTRHSQGAFLDSPVNINYVLKQNREP